MRGFTLPSCLAAVLLALLVPRGADAQELSLKRDLPALPESPCALVPSVDPAEDSPSPARRAEAERLSAEANQAAILGDHRSARSLLRDAADLDPTSPVIAYRLGRVLEEGGAEDDALVPYCRYLALASDGPDAADVRERVERMVRARQEVSPAARAAFEAGITDFDRGDHEGAARSFSRALVEYPEWADAYYNRGVAQLHLGRRGAAGSDLERYLELSPDSGDREAVREELRLLQPAAAPVYRPGTALVTGMVIPGMGHFYSGRPATGFLILAAAGTSAGVGLFYREVEVRCRSALVSGQCPPDQVADRVETQPFLAPALATAGAITLAGALHAYLSTRRGAERALAIGGGLEIPVPVLARDDRRSVLRVEPGDGWGTGGVRASLGVRF